MVRPIAAANALDTPTLIGKFHLMISFVDSVITFLTAQWSSNTCGPVINKRKGVGGEGGGKEGAIGLAGRRVQGEGRHGNDDDKLHTMWEEEEEEEEQGGGGGGGGGGRREEEE